APVPALRPSHNAPSAPSPVAPLGTALRPAAPPVDQGPSPPSLTRDAPRPRFRPVARRATPICPSAPSRPPPLGPSAPSPLGPGLVAQDAVSCGSVSHGHVARGLVARGLIAPCLIAQGSAPPPKFILPLPAALAPATRLATEPVTPVARVLVAPFASLPVAPVARVPAASAAAHHLLSSHGPSSSLALSFFRYAGCTPSEGVLHMAIPACS
ncbi:unnamed protein product, partial [Closterium sp. NIES-54]